MEAWAKAGGGRGCGCREDGWVGQADLRGPLKSEEKGGLPLGGNREPEKVRIGRRKPVVPGYQEARCGCWESPVDHVSVAGLPCTPVSALYPLSPPSFSCFCHSLCPVFFQVPFCLSVF